MKTKVLNFVMPVFVFIMAIGLAFATETEDNSRIGYYLDPDTQTVKSVPVDCDSSIAEICEYEGNQVFADEGLNDELYKTSL